MDSSEIQQGDVIKQMVPHNMKRKRLAHDIIKGQDGLTVSSLPCNQDPSIDGRHRQQQLEKEGGDILQCLSLYLP
jgi:hypothetical protein